MRLFIFSQTLIKTQGNIITNNGVKWYTSAHLTKFFSWKQILANFYGILYFLLFDNWDLLLLSKMKRVVVIFELFKTVYIIFFKWCFFFIENILYLLRGFYFTHFFLHH